MMEKLETLAIVLCVSMLAGLAVYTVDLLNVARNRRLDTTRRSNKKKHSSMCYPILSNGCL